MPPIGRLDGPRPLLWLAWLGAAATVLYFVGSPLASTEYPMMTDFPMHTASASVFRHYGDPEWHFREQFVFQLFSVPSLTLYGSSAAFMLLLPPVAATKLAAGLMLAMLPVGLMVLCWGMRKSPFLGLWGLVPVWGVLTSWGFINFVAAIGLFALCLGLAFRAADRPSTRVQVGLVLALLLLFVTHVFRFPFALGGMWLVALAMYGRVGSLRGLIVPSAAAGLLLALWWFNGAADIPMYARWAWPPAWSRLITVEANLTDVLIGEGDLHAFRRVGMLFLATAAVLALVAIPRIRQRLRDRWTVPAHAVVVVIIVTSVCLYLTLPMEIGTWWYVYPRELTVAMLFTPALLPDLPRKTWAQLGFVAWTAIAIAPIRDITAEAYRDFGVTTSHFREIIRELPMAPKLLYLVYDHAGSQARHTPFVHLPAYVQAELGGWLSFHFADTGHSPLRYRERQEPGAVVPPPTPLRWEWSPQLFELERDGGFFDWFLVRRSTSPDDLFASEPAIRRVAHFEDWWLYHRSPSPTGPAREKP